MIEQNVLKKLSLSVLKYRLIYFIGGLVVALIMEIYKIIFYGYSQIDGIFIVAVIIISALNIAYIYLFWNKFEYTITSGSILIKSGIIFRNDKSLNFNDIESISAEYGPVMRFFGVKQVNGYTASPQQLKIVDKNSSEHIPDLDILIDEEIADELVVLCQKNDIQKVQSVQQV